MSASSDFAADVLTCEWRTQLMELNSGFPGISPGGSLQIKRQKKLSFIKHTGNSQKQVIQPLKQSNEEGG